MGGLARVLFFGVLCVVCVRAATRRTNQPVPCDDLKNLQSRITYLQNTIQERTGMLADLIKNTSHIRHTSKRELDHEGDAKLQKQLNKLSADMAFIKRSLQNISTAENRVNEERELENNIKDIFGPPTTPQPNKRKPANCLEILQAGPNASSGMYEVQPKGGNQTLLVYCDMATRDGGWLTIHNRFDGQQNFFNGWTDYKFGFGNIAGEHWLGLERVYEVLGNEIHELLIQIEDNSDVLKHAYYSHFAIGSEQEGYALKLLGGYKGNAGDSLLYHAGSKFTTVDNDQDSWDEGNCAQNHGGAWWYKSCAKVNLNGRYLPGDLSEEFIYQPMYWESFGGPQHGLKHARMLIRPRRYSQ